MTARLVPVILVLLAANAIAEGPLRRGASKASNADKSPQSHPGGTLWEADPLDPQQSPGRSRVRTASAELTPVPTMPPGGAAESGVVTLSLDDARGLALANN